MELSAVLTPASEGGYVAFNPETGTTTQGETVEEALLNLRKATELYLEEFPLSIVGTIGDRPRFSMSIERKVVLCPRFPAVSA